jgi:tripartite-type tricarboxylate transporter receptor subunit TctC
MRLAAAALLTAALASGPAFSQSYRIVVPFPPGGGADALARLMAPKLSEIWKDQVLVENKPGASGHIGADFVAQSPGDGKTLLMSSTASLTEKNVHQFAPVTLVSASPYVVTASTKTTFTSIRELISFARAHPGKLTYGSSGTGAASHLSAELFKSMAKVDLLHVPYKGTGQAVTDLLAGQIDLLFAPSQAVIQHVAAGKLKALATTGNRRPETLPNLPTVGEAGIPGYEAVGWFGLLAPAATPRSLVFKISADANRVLADPDIRTRMQALGADPAGNTPDEFARFIRSDQAKWANLMRAAGIKPEGS